jgi:dTMP kinase
VGLRDKAPYAGRLIALCGVDGSGKSTQVKLLAESLRPVASVSVVRPVTQALRDDPAATDYLDGRLPPDQMHDMVAELPLLVAAHGFRQMRTVILPRLQAGDIVLCDRYVYDSYARAWSRGFDDQEWLCQLNRYLPEPDLTVYFDVRPEEALRRIRARGDEPRWEEGDPVRIAAAREAFRTQPWGPRDTYRIVDAQRPVDEIAATVRELVASTLGLAVAAR